MEELFFLNEARITIMIPKKSLRRKACSSTMYVMSVRICPQCGHSPVSSTYIQHTSSSVHVIPQCAESAIIFLSLQIAGLFPSAVCSLYI